MSPSTRSRFWTVATLATIAAVTLFYFASVRVTIDVYVSTTADQVTLHIPHKNINGILMLRTSNETQVLWEVLTSYDTGTTFVYGALPSGGNATARQTVPTAGRQPIDIRGQKVTIEIDYRS